ncbi:zinc finger CCHC domain-containing protein 7 [Carcharodon carcharias]|uniref:zinc finger CCHC domain-containing protein 7 n=1 Tax=Carcharodon carcharias TaxID=13397 RepID=UPI001B7F36D2|nr:zinc finger CCHC domain-containing protein 7 [Carcharodon carcharias]XP_041041174.1 zinc finger CCHC domain-containing protein 7 [Carcharodon carcharias]
MFAGYEDLEAYEDELYREESSSETEIDSDVEFQLYSQVHYANNLPRVKIDRELGTASLDIQTATVEDNIKLVERTKSAIVISDSEVIVTSDSPDVIILSDTEDGDSVYAFKGVKPFKCEVSERKDQSKVEPAQESARSAHRLAPSMDRLTQLQKLSQCMGSSSLCRKSPQTQGMTMIEGNESSGAEEDGKIESWMVLGHDQKEENDDNIQLNIVSCGTLRNEEGDLHTHWSICRKDLESLFGKQRSRYYAPNKTSMDCRNCGKLGHISKNCPSPKKFPACCLCGVRGHLQRGCPERYCTNCNMPGHWFQNCIERAYWKKQCHRCQMTGHYADACPEIWRQYHLTINQGPIVNGCSQHVAKKSVYCYNCAKQGHYGHECSSKWMHNHTFPTSPFVYYYDTKRDIQMREWRIQKKVEELQDAGLLETNFPTKRLRRETASKDSLTKKMKKKRKRELLKKKRVEQEGREFMRNSGMAKHKAKHCHQTLHCPKTFSEGVEEDFPREFTAQSTATHAPQYKTQQSPLLFMHSNTIQNEGHVGPTRKKKNKIRKKKRHTEGETIELARKRRKKAKKTKVHVREGMLSAPDNGLTMKQKEKKHKKHYKIKSQESVN